jgi:predicted enzyme related to lactoylglutathione lyase
MVFTGVVIHTRNINQMLSFYEFLFECKAYGEGNHFAFSDYFIALYKGEKEKQGTCHTLMYETKNLVERYEAILSSEYSELITSTPELKPWGLYSFQLNDPDGNEISIIEVKG